MSEPNGIHTVDELIEALGGTSEVARRTGWKPSRISNWRTGGRFPDSLAIHDTLRELCAENKVELDPALFGPSRAESAA